MTNAERADKAGWMDGDAVAYHARLRPGRRACLDLRSGESLSFAELDRLAARCAGLLRGTLGDCAGERVASLLRNGIDALALMYACERVGVPFAEPFPREDYAKLARNDLRVFVKRFVKIAYLKKQNHVRVAALDLNILSAKRRGHN